MTPKEQVAEIAGGSGDRLEMIAGMTPVAEIWATRPCGCRAILGRGPTAARAWEDARRALRAAGVATREQFDALLSSAHSPCLGNWTESVGAGNPENRC